jgi:ABC-type oligopeptide transport system ATPase subunit
MSITGEIRKTFPSIGVPEFTYVSREKGKYEDELSMALDSGNLVVVMGPSKTGKSCLCRKILQRKGLNELVVTCNEHLPAEEVWASALQQARSSRVMSFEESRSKQTNMAGKISGNIGIKLLAHLKGELSSGIEGSKTKGKRSEPYQTKPSPLHLSRHLNDSKYVLVIDSINRLSTPVQKTICQQLKSIVELNICTIIIATTNYINSMCYYNSDLAGRINPITYGCWNRSDLSVIAEKGFKHLNVQIQDKNVFEMIGRESAGLPIIVQQACQMVLQSKACSLFAVGPDDMADAFHKIAKTNYAGLEFAHGELAKGLRKAASKYSTYKQILRAFSLDPIRFSMNREDLIQRIVRLDTSGSPSPTRASVDNALKSLDALQKKISVRVFHWNQTTHELEIIEPAFLFYLRWRQKRRILASPDEAIAVVLEQMSQRHE